MELANRESQSSWRDFLIGLKGRGLHGMEFVVSDDHPGLKGGDPRGAARGRLAALLRALPEDALDYVPRKVDADCLQELRRFYDRRELAEVRRDIATWLAKWQGKYPKLCAWVEDNIEETLTYYRLPLQHHKHARAPQPKDQAAHPCRAHLAQRRELPAAGACPRHRDPRELARGRPLPQHGALEGAQEGGPAGRGRLTAAGLGQRCAIRGLRAAQARHHTYQPFAAHN